MAASAAASVPVSTKSFPSAAAVAREEIYSPRPLSWRKFIIKRLCNVPLRKEKSGKRKIDNLARFKESTRSERFFWVLLFEAFDVLSDGKAVSAR